jgi:putative glutamine amidotransferase
MKKIGIVGWNTGDNSFGVTKPYIDWLSKFGIVQILSPQQGVDETIDLLVLPGGLDIAPQSMGQVPGFYTSNTDVMKQYFYDNNLDQYLQRGTPIFGICLGFQQLCVKFGGQLVQNYGFAYSNKGRHEKVDTLKVVSDELYKIVDEVSFKKIKKYEVNSLHHQGCFLKGIEGTSIEALAIEQDFKNIEIAKFSENVYGVQYHPEEINDGLSTLIIKKLLNYNE